MVDFRVRSKLIRGFLCNMRGPAPLEIASTESREQQPTPQHCNRPQTHHANTRALKTKDYTLTLTNFRSSTIK